MSTTTVEVKERPILFSAPMVRALLAGTKTQTRRMVKGLGVFVDTEMRMGPPSLDREVGWIWEDGTTARCPYGSPGDRLWVKETWRPRSNAGAFNEDDDSVTITYAADGEERHFDGYGGDEMPADFTLPKSAARGDVSPLFMPRWASRITLEITGVRAERLQEITEADAVTEGCVRPVIGCALDEFFKLWESINGKGSWALNPWVWVVSFRQMPQQPVPT